MASPPAVVGETAPIYVRYAELCGGWMGIRKELKRTGVDNPDVTLTVPGRQFVVGE